MDTVTHLLDTHAVISQAPPRSLGVSDFTLLEIAMLVSKKRLKLDLSLLSFLERIESD